MMMNLLTLAPAMFFGLAAFKSCHGNMQASTDVKGSHSASTTSAVEHPITAIGDTSKVRSRRQIFMGTCFWGQAIEAACIAGQCFRGYVCDPSAGFGGRCCLPPRFPGPGIGYLPGAWNGNTWPGINTPRCSDGTLSTGPCSFDGFCSDFRSVCYFAENLCCRSVWYRGERNKNRPGKADIKIRGKQSANA